MGELRQLRQMSEDIGLQGPDIINFVREQQENSREERRLQREAEAATRAHELEIIRLTGEMLKIKNQEIMRRNYLNSPVLT